MAVKVMQGITRYIGTAAEIAAYDISKANIGSTFFESDTGILKIVNQAGVLVNAPSETVGLSGSTLDLRGLAADKPAAAAANKGITYWSIDTGVIEVSTGAAWVVV